MKATKITLIVCFIGLALSWGCKPATVIPSPTSAPPPTPTPEAVISITLGDISDEPSKKIERFQPLADYLAAHLAEFGPVEGRVLIAPDMETMAEYLRTGQVDLYFDSPFPTIVVCELSGARSILRRWKEGLPEYWTVFIVHKESGIETLDDLKGQMIAFEDPASTSAYLLPKATLIEQGFTLTAYDDVSASVGSDEIGYVFSRDEENTVQWILHRRVDVGAVSNLDYDELPGDQGGIDDH